jgi:predicted nuclease of predicted toxin-antitoxin system
MKLYFDEHVHPLVAVMLSERGIDCRTTQEAGNLGMDDEDQLRYATAQGRVLVTFDRRDFLMLARQWASTNQSHAGLILSTQCPIPELLRNLLRCHTRHQHDNLTDHILWLQNYKEPPIL